MPLRVEIAHIAIRRDCLRSCHARSRCQEETLSIRRIGPPADTSRASRATARMASAISSSDTSTRLAASPRGMNESTPGNTPDRAGDPVLDERGDDRLAGAAGASGLVDDHHPADGTGVGDDLVDRQRDEPADVEHTALDALGGAAARLPAATGRARSPTRPPARRRRRARRGPSRSVRARCSLPSANPRRRARAGRVCGRARSARGTRSPCRRRRRPRRTCAASTRASAPVAGDATTSTGDVAEHAEAVVVVEVPPEALLVAVAGDAHHHPVAVLAAARRTTASPLRRGAGRSALCT